jgi:DNA polymerase
VKEKILKKIAEKIKKCKECKKDKFGLAVPGEGNPNAKIFFVGEAPGFRGV